MNGGSEFIKHGYSFLMESEQSGDNISVQLNGPA